MGNECQCANCGAITPLAVCPECGYTDWYIPKPLPVYQTKYGLTEEEKDAVIQMALEDMAAVRKKFRTGTK